MEFFYIHKLRSLIGLFTLWLIMIILSWNVRGVGKESLTHEINEFVKLYHPDMVFLWKLELIVVKQMLLSLKDLVIIFTPMFKYLLLALRGTLVVMEQIPLILLFKFYFNKIDLSMELS